MPTFDHMSVGVSDVKAAIEFYDGFMELFAARRHAEHERFAAYGEGSPEFFVMLPFDGVAATAGNGVHDAFRAQYARIVGLAHAYATARGGSCEGPPGPREGYPRAEVCITYVRDPFGKKLEVISGGA